ncbi:MAG TPA: ATP synthase F1 subunit gamma [Candidatus Saccharimonadia bacterium]|jgi:F-type H+-transporting ATPase subunit gamma|nr:ATP synthase F1 subunit gamma [Candidatus Saccharimonadia bacterium]
MPSLQIINRRRQSVRNTRQITKAMQMVAASKLRRAQMAATGPQAYTQAARELLANLGMQSVAATHPLFAVRPVKNVLTIVIAGDRGMAGGYNSNVIRALGRHIKEVPGTHKAIAIGKRAASSVARAKDIEEIASFDADVHDTATMVALPVLQKVTELYEAGEIDAVYVISTDFISTVTQKVALRQVLPVTPPDKAEDAVQAEMEPAPEDLIDTAVRRVLEAEVLQAVLEARASEEASRMIAMMNASDNASDIISDLTLLFNNARQGKITQEISEISAGAEAISKQ